MKKILPSLSVFYLSVLLASCLTKGKKEENVTSDSTKVDTVNQTQQIQSADNQIDNFEELDSVQYRFKDFIRLFETPGITPVKPIYTGTGYVINSIPDFAVKKFIQTEDADFPGGGYFAQRVIALDSYYLCFYIQYRAVGPGLDVVNVSSFDETGNLISSIVLGEIYTSPEEENECDYQYDAESRVIEVSNKLTTHDMGIEDSKDKITETNRHFKLNENGTLTEIP